LASPSAVTDDVTLFYLKSDDLSSSSSYLLVMVWRSSSALVSINEVSMRMARLVLGWVIVSGFNSRCGTFI